MTSLTQIAELYGLHLTRHLTLPLPPSAQLTRGLSEAPAHLQGGALMDQGALRDLFNDLFNNLPNGAGLTAPELAAPALTAPLPLTPARPSEPAPALDLPSELDGWRVTCAPLSGEGERRGARLSVYSSAPLRGLRLNERAALTPSDVLGRGAEEASDQAPQGPLPSLPPLHLDFDLMRGERVALLSDDGRGLVLSLGALLEVALTGVPRPLDDLPACLSRPLDDLGALAKEARSSVTAQTEALGELWRRARDPEVREALVCALDDLGVWSELCTQGALERCARLARLIEEVAVLDPFEERQELIEGLAQLVEGREALERALSAEEALELNAPTRAAADALDARARSLLASRASSPEWRALPRPRLSVKAPARHGQWWRLLAP